MREWTNSSLGMYINDGALFTCSHSWRKIKQTLRDCYSTCDKWLTQAGLNIEPDKTELIFFCRRGEQTMPPHYIHLPLPSTQTYYCVPAANTLCYLGFFFDAHLSWPYHVDVMCNRAYASIKALKLLGNLVRGLDHASWRLTFNAICLPVLTYSCQLWFHGKQVTLVKKLQIVQNKAVKIISGTFCTTPCKPLHQLLSILPMDLQLTKLTQNMALTLYQVLSESQLLTRLGGDW